MKSYLKNLVILLVISTITGCVTTQPTLQRQSAIPTGLVLQRVEMHGLRIVVFITQAVAQAVGTEILDDLYGRGWVQVTHQDVNNTAEIDVMCELDAVANRVTVQCQAISLRGVTTPVSTSSVIVDGGIANARMRITDLIESEYADAIAGANSAYLRKSK